MFRISVTTLEKFRRYMKGVSVYDTEASLIESLKGIFTGNDKTMFGSAYHKIVEDEFLLKHGGIYVESDDRRFVFDLPVARPALDYSKAHPLMFHEVKTSKIFQTEFFPIQVSGRIDGIEGAFVRDIKTKFRSVDWTEYMDSCQWKFYLEMFGLDVFFYDLFEVQQFTELSAGQPHKIKDVEVIAHPEFKCERYDYMSEDVNQILNHFLEYIHMKGFLHLLKPALPEEPILNF